MVPPTKLNAPALFFDAELRQKLDELVVGRAFKGADWVVLAEVSLPPGEPTTELVATLRASGYEGKIAIDTSEAADCDRCR